jgi:RNA polymerase sigma-70 factor (ECF subfamily)
MGSPGHAAPRSNGVRQQRAVARVQSELTLRRSAADLTVAVSRAVAGDEDAFRAVYRAVQPGILRYLRGLVGDEAEDVASEAWAQIARDIRTFEGDSDGFRGWAATIARHRALDYLRRQRRRPVHPTAVEELTELTANDDTAALALDAVSTSEAVAMIATLPRDQAEAVLLRVVMGLDAMTAGQVLGKRAGAVRIAAHRGLRRLADRLDQTDVTRLDQTDGGGSTLRPRGPADHA